MSRFRTSAVARLLTCNIIFQRLKGEKNSLHGLLHQESGKRGYFQKQNVITYAPSSQNARLAWIL